MIVLDTNVVSELIRPVPDAGVLRWVDSQLADALWLCSPVAQELWFGIQRLPTGARQTRLAQAVTAMLEEDFFDRVLPYDMQAAITCAELLARREQQGRSMALPDAQIAAICLSHQATLATRNTKDFAGADLMLINPWDAST
jgi:predicted nucleic acid-binding protein